MVPQDALIFTPLIVGILQAIKMALPESAKKFIPLLSIVIGLGVVYFFGTGELKDNILLGIILGLSSVGLYQGGKEFYSKNPSNNEQPSFDITPEIGEFR